MKVLGWVVLAVIALGVIGSQVGGEDEGSSAPQAVAGRSDAEAVTGKVAGTFRRNCLFCDDRLKDMVATADAWCGWRGDRVVVHVTMRNDSVEHVTVDWHPSYVIAGGGEHGAGLTAVESSGFDAGETRQLLVEQDPEGVAPGAAIEECKPSFSTIESG